MNFSKNLPQVSFICFIAMSILSVVVGFEINTFKIIAVTVAIFLTCFLSACHMLGYRSAFLFLAVAIVFGWLGEQIGVHTGYVFGEYEFTDVLGPRLGNVPVVIPLMWFNACYVCLVISNLIIWRAPLHGSQKSAVIFSQGFLAAVLVTAYDLGLDPYMVFKAKAWIMKKSDGWWFGETLHGFLGWFFVSFLILTCFQFLSRKTSPRPAANFGKFHALIPVAVYASWMCFQIIEGVPFETRTIAVFAMGTPVICCLLAFDKWKWNQKRAYPDSVQA
jgi:uncharacterized membrane protein